jgi:alpha-mannosidase
VITTEPRIHLIGNAHIDPVWLWRWQEGYAEIKATFRSALDRMNDYDDFVFTCACAAYYRWVEENAPEMFEEIRRRVAEGRWVIVGGWWVQPDCNLPSGESFVRHGLYSQRYFQSRFGTIATVGYNVDSFGHNGMLPQILVKSGMPFYAFQRPQEREKHLPSDVFWWESPDGSRVLTFRLNLGYATWWSEPGVESPVERRIRETTDLAHSHGHDMMCFYGVGNHGGGPTIVQLEEIRRMQKRAGDERLLLSSPPAYFAAVQQQKPALPTVRDDLQHHASGCYSTHSESKAANRRAEQRLLAAETIASIAHGLVRHEFPAASVRRSWERVMFNQFHDVMGGCSIAEAFADVRETHGEALSIAAEVLNAAAQRVSWAIDTSGGRPCIRDRCDFRLWMTEEHGSPLVVFNPLPWERVVPVQTSREVASVTGHTGEDYVCQQVRASQRNHGDMHNTLFAAPVPAFGYRLFWLHTARRSTTAPADTMVTAAGSALENRFVKIEIDPRTGWITSITDKVHNRAVCRGPAAVPIVIDNSKADTWAHGIFSFRDEVGRFSNAQVKLVESGPVRAWLRVTSHYGSSTLRQDFQLYAHSPRIHVRARLDWREPLRMLKLSFPLNLDNPVATYETPYGFIERPADGEEEPGLRWVDLSGTDPGTERRAGLALLNDSKYSFDARENDLRMTCVNSAVYAEHFIERDDLVEYMDLGPQDFAYALLPHAGSWAESGVVRAAIELNTEAVQVPETFHEGPLPAHFQGVTIDADNVIANAFKRSEEGDGYVLRCYETAGRPCGATIALASPVRSWKADFGASEIKTFLVPDDPAQDVREVNLLEW